MPHKSGKKSYGATPGHPAKGMPPKGTHEMPDGHLMKDKDMPKGMPPKKMGKGMKKGR